MKKLFVLVGSILVAGCFVCHKGGAPEATPEKPVVQASYSYSFPDAANFEFDSSVAEVNKDAMNSLYKGIKAHPDAVIVVKGHTDNVGTEAYNKKLSMQRAEAVAELIKQHGYTNPIELKGLWYSEPVATNETEEGRAQNRRVDVLLMHDEQK